MERRVLVVEDDPHVLRLLTDLLKADQYDVITAMDGEAGLRAFTPGEIDVVVTNVRGWTTASIGIHCCRRRIVAGRRKPYIYWRVMMSQEKPRAKQPYIVPELTSYGSLQRQKGERSMFLEGTGNVVK